MIAANDTFIRGETVFLKSGSPPLQVSSMSQEGIKCAWVGKDKLHFKVFNHKTLTKER